MRFEVERRGDLWRWILRPDRSEMSSAAILSRWYPTRGECRTALMLFRAAVAAAAIEES